MPIKTPRRRHIQHSSFTRNRRSNFREWLDQEGSRLATTARAVRDSLKRLGLEIPEEVELATDATPADIGVASNGFDTGGVAFSVVAGVFTHGTATTWQSLGFAVGDKVEVTYSGADFPVEERYISEVSVVDAVAMTLDPAPPDNAWPATTEINVSSLSDAGRD